MSTQSLIFERVVVERMLGIRSGHGFTLAGFCEGLNVIYGANGVGKSTTAVALGESLWPGGGTVQRPSLRATWKIGESVWEVDIDAGYPSWRCDGKAGPAPELGPLSNHGRYRLALEALIAQTGSDFARVIANESRGGYDLEAAVNALGFREDSRSRRKESQAVNAARRQVVEARKAEHEVLAEQNRLSDLREERQRAIESQTRLSRLEAAREYQKLDREVTGKEAELATYSPTLQELRGDEYESLSSIEAEMSRLQGEIDKQESIHAKAVQDQLATKLISAIESQALLELREDQRALAALEHDVRQLQEKLADKEAVRKSLEQRLAKQGLSPEQCEAINAVELKVVSQFAKTLQQLQGEAEAIKAQKAWLSQASTSGKPTGDPTSIVQGLTALNRWLATPRVSEVFRRSISWPAIVASVLLLVAAILAGAFLDPLWYTASLVAGVVVVAELILVKRFADNTVSSEHSVHKKSYIAAGLPEPEAWSPAEVEALLQPLSRQLGEAATASEVRRKLGDLRTRVDGWQQRAEQIRQQQRQIRSQLGLSVGVGDDWLPVLVSTIEQWQTARSEVAGVAASLELKQGFVKEKLQSIQERLSRHGYEEISNAESTAAALDGLSQRNQAYKEATNQLDGAETLLEKLQAELDEQRSKRKDLLSHVGLDEESAYKLKQLCDQRPAFNSLSRDCHEKKVVRDSLADRLEGHEELLDLSEDELEAAILEESSRAGSREAISQQIGGIEQQIAAAKGGTRLSDALEQQESAEDALAVAREEERLAVVGGCLARWVRAKSLEHSKPRVYERARELLLRYTNGRLLLELDEDSEGAALVVRIGSSVQQLNELSLGEKVQTMLAVRVAFLEQDEIIRLPFVFDEALATTDERRAEQIMDAVAALILDGRQVFYFTSQAEDVGRWQEIATRKGISHACIDLAQLRQDAAFKATPLVKRSRTTAPIPAAGKRSRDEYGKVLRVPGLLHFSDCPEQVHLWHVVDDLAALERMLQHDVSTWQQLERLIERGDYQHFPQGRELIVRAKARYRAIGSALSASRIGHGQKVNREVLIESGIVTDAFIDRLSEVAKECDGDAERILAALEAKEVERWRSSNTECLREYFEDQGHIVNEEPLSYGELRLRIASTVARELKAGEISEEVLDEIALQVAPTEKALKQELLNSRLNPDPVSR